MALNANALVQLAPMRVFLGVPTATVDANLDALIEDFINSTSAMAESFCNRNLRSQTYTEYYDGGQTSEILINNWPIVSITSIHISSARVFDATTLLVSTSYDSAPNEIGEKVLIDRFDGVFPKGKRNVKIVYVAGYASFSDVPADLVLAVKIAVAYYYLRQQQKDWTMTTKNKGDENISLVQGLPESSRQILDRYKRLEMLAPTNSLSNY